ncbi:Cyanate hydratase [Glutinoglossum americanum]|uniref:Cyanate hydratase n=1 Tax=Glutinoglossum americanum TaxID=1670608 RepID=A0A9P8HZF5_9PEZI|nr:Cyanate hydratase [Glutinoglossum americanum]
MSNWHTYNRKRTDSSFWLPDINYEKNGCNTRLLLSTNPSPPRFLTTLFTAKAQRGLAFAELGQELGHDGVAVAALFYGQAQASKADILKLSQVLEIPYAQLQEQLSGFPDRGHTVDLPPREPLIYRLFEVVQNYGYGYKAVLNERLGDGIMSAISFTTKVDMEVDA